MPQSIVKVVLSLAMLGVARLLGQVCWMVPWVFHVKGLMYPYMSDYAVESVVVLLGWWLIWRHDVRWTGTRILLTVAVGAVPLGGLLSLAAYEQFHRGQLTFSFSQSVLAIARLAQGLLPLILVLIWRQTADERSPSFIRQGAQR